MKLPRTLSDISWILSYSQIKGHRTRYVNCEKSFQNDDSIYFYPGTAKLRGCESISHVPPALNKLLDRGIGYCNESVVFEDDGLNGTIGISSLEHQIDTLVTKYGSKFILAIVQSTSTWALITHLDAFYQQDSYSG